MFESFIEYLFVISGFCFMGLVYFFCVTEFPPAAKLVDDVSELFPPESNEQRDLRLYAAIRDRLGVRYWSFDMVKGRISRTVWGDGSEEFCFDGKLLIRFHAPDSEGNIRHSKSH